MEERIKVYVKLVMEAFEFYFHLPCSNGANFIFMGDYYFVYCARTPKESPCFVIKIYLNGDIMKYRVKISNIFDNNYGADSIIFGPYNNFYSEYLLKGTSDTYNKLLHKINLDYVNAEIICRPNTGIQ
jgi:hypothetical protein